jgi:hypothetical protein
MHDRAFLPGNLFSLMLLLQILLDELHRTIYVYKETIELGFHDVSMCKILRAQYTIASCHDLSNPLPLGLPVLKSCLVTYNRLIEFILYLSSTIYNTILRAVFYNRPMLFVYACKQHVVNVINFNSNMHKC